MGAILGSLGVDITFVYQFIIGLVFFISAKFLFFKKLKEVIEARNEKTVGLSKNADTRFEEAEKLSAEYKKNIDEAYQEAQEIFKEKTSSVVKECEEEMSKSLEESEKYIEERKKEFAEDFNEKRSKVLNEAEHLSGELVNRIIK